MTQSPILSAEPIRLAREYARDPNSWPFAPRFDPQRRWYARLYADHGHEAWLLTWLPGQTTELHDHGGAGGAFTVISGRIAEDVAGPRAAPRLSTLNWTRGRVRGFGPYHIHRVYNPGTAPAVTLHVYAPGLTTMSHYDFTDGELTLLRTEREGTDW